MDTRTVGPSATCLVTVSPPLRRWSPWVCGYGAGACRWSSSPMSGLLYTDGEAPLGCWPGWRTGTLRTASGHLALSTVTPLLQTLA